LDRLCSEEVKGLRGLAKAPCPFFSRAATSIAGPQLENQSRSELTAERKPNHCKQQDLEEHARLCSHNGERRRCREMNRKQLTGICRCAELGTEERSRQNQARNSK
jgi:hypothetical protein